MYCVKSMKEKPKCALCDNDAFILCNIEGFDKPQFVCMKCYTSNPKVKSRVRGI